MSSAHLTFMPAPQKRAPSNRVVWRPLEASQLPLFVQTWDEVAERIERLRGDVSVFLASDATVPATADVDCFGITEFVNYQSPGRRPVLTVEAGAILRNVKRLASVEFSSQGGTALLFPPGSSLALDYAILSQASSATAPLVDIQGPFALFQRNRSIIRSTASAPVFRGPSGGTSVEHSIIDLDGDIPSNLWDVSSFSSGTITAVVDASVLDYPVGVPFSLVRKDYSIGVSYNDSLVLPLLGTATLQDTADVLKRRTTGSGPTASRPAIPADIDTGGAYFDTDLGFPIFSNGTIYVDSAGNPA